MSGKGIVKMLENKRPYIALAEASRDKSLPVHQQKVISQALIASNPDNLMDKPKASEQLSDGLRLIKQIYNPEKSNTNEA